MSYKIDRKTFDKVMENTRQGVDISVFFSSAVNLPPIDPQKNGNTELLTEETVKNEKTSMNITEKNIIAGSFSIDRYVASGDNIEIGSAIAAELKMTLDNHKGNFDDVDFNGAKLYVRLKVKTDDGLISYIPMGVFMVDEQVKNQTTVELTALDGLVAFDKIFDFSLYPKGMNIRQILYAIFSKCVNDISPDEYFINLDLPNLDYVPSSYPEGEEITCRQILQWICEITGSCAYMDAEGNLKLEFYDYFFVPNTTEVFNITPNIRYSSEYSNTSLTLNKLVVNSKDGNVTKEVKLTNEYTLPTDTSEIEGEENQGDESVNTLLSYTIGGNELITSPEIVENKEDTPEEGDVSGGEDGSLDFTDDEEEVISYDETYVNKVINGLSNMKVINYLPFKATTISLPFLWPLVKIVFTDNMGNGFESIVTHHTFNLNGSSEIEAKGTTEQKASYASANPLTKHESNIISNVKEELKKELSKREKDILALNKIPGAMLGLYSTAKRYDDGSVVYYYHNKETLKESNIVYELSENGFRWTNNYNDEEPIWSFGLSDEGSFIANYISTVGINAKWINVESSDEVKENNPVVQSFSLTETNLDGENTDSLEETQTGASIYLANGNIDFKVGENVSTKINTMGIETSMANINKNLRIGDFMFDGSEGNLTITYLQGGEE